MDGIVFSAPDCRWLCPCLQSKRNQSISSASKMSISSGLSLYPREDKTRGSRKISGKIIFSMKLQDPGYGGINQPVVGKTREVVVKVPPWWISSCIKDGCIFLPQPLLRRMFCIAITCKSFCRSSPGGNIPIVIREGRLLDKRRHPDPGGFPAL